MKMITTVFNYVEDLKLLLFSSWLRRKSHLLSWLNKMKPFLDIFPCSIQERDLRATRLLLVCINKIIIMLCYQYYYALHDTVIIVAEKVAAKELRHHTL